MTQQQEWEGAENKKKIDIEAIENMGFVPQNEEWEERFVKVYYDKTQDGRPYAGDPLFDRIKSFIAQEIQKAKEEKNKFIPLLKVARCPYPDCDNNGTIAVRVSEDEWEPQQCQWCDEKSKALKDLTNNLTEK